ncbi:MAG: phosphatidylglycerophosphatase A [Bdellovibrio sp.]|nr:MAG: phosphatidylglycerophosphatase A [Bdellovibrio sp.]
MTLNSFRIILKQMATWFGVGFLRPAPGTWGTLAAVPLAILCVYAGLAFHLTVCLILFPLSILAAEVYEQDKGEHDCSEIVVDEVLGYLVTVVGMPLSWQTFLIGFFVFRLLDIWKPLFIGYLDQKVKGGTGTVVDDVAAGLIGNLGLQMILKYSNILGA